MTLELASFGFGLNVVVVGALGGIGGALADELDACSVISNVVRLSRSPLAIHGTKETILYTRDHSVEDSLKYIAAWQTGMFQPADMAEVFAAKAEGRDTEFDDLGAIRRGL